MSLTYNSWFASFFNRVAAVSTATTLSPGGGISSYTDPNWVTELPNVIDYAEQRIYRELDLLNERVIDQSGVLIAGNRSFILPNVSGNWVVVEYINVSTAAGLSVTVSRSPLVPVSRAYMDFAWPSAGNAQGIPNNWTPITQTPTAFTINLGPTPDQAYTVEVIGTQRPSPLSSGNPTTFLTTVLPDLFFTATMVAAAGYMRDYGQQSDNPAQSVSWEQQYNLLMKSALSEETRKTYRSGGWTAQQTRPESTPPRT